jgi:hypothetical protein
MKNQFIAWGKKNLTIMVKILIIKTLILPKFTFLASSCVIPRINPENDPTTSISFMAKVISVLELAPGF